MQLENILVIQNGSGEMSVFVVETYLVAPEKREKFKLLMQRLFEYKKENHKEKRQKNNEKNCTFS